MLKLGLIWAPTEDLTLRGTWGTSFRAPALTELSVDPADAFVLFANFPDPSAPDGLTTSLYRVSGFVPLGPETSTACTIGVDYQPKAIEGFAPTRSGKGVGLVVPTLLSWTGSAVIHDIKGENWTLCGRATSKRERLVRRVCSGRCRV